VKTTIQELKFFIQEAIEEVLLAEVDLTQIPPQWMSTYAFVQAYNDGLAQGLFPRHQRMDIEFTDEKKSQFRNGTLFVSTSELPTIGFFKYDAGHDLLHGLTQNLQPQFGTFKSTSDVSKGNERKFSAQDLRRFFDYAQKKYGINLKQKFPIIPPSNQLQSFLKTIEPYVFSQNNLELNKEFLKMTYKRDHFTQRFNPDGSFATKTQNPTHAVEEELGNVVSDALAKPLANNELFTPALIEEIKQGLKQYSPGGEFGMIKSPETPRIIERWQTFLTNLLPEFSKLYNARLSRLKSTKFGAKTYK
jgi:hypothetical protein